MDAGVWRSLQFQGCNNIHAHHHHHVMGNRVDDDENKAEALSNSNLSAFTNWQIRV